MAGIYGWNIWMELAFQSNIRPVMWNYLTKRHICFKMETISTEVEYHPRAILYVFARVRLCFWVYACEVHCLLAAKLQNELGKLMQLLIYLWDLYHTVMCKLGIFVCFACGIGKDTSGMRFWSVYTHTHIHTPKKNKIKKSSIWTFHISVRLLCVNHLRGDL